MKLKFQLLALALLFASTAWSQGFNFIAPEKYQCEKIESDLHINGDINKPEWKNAQWTNPFVDIEGREINKPYFNTKAKMLWNDEFLYFAFHIEEQHIWASITERDEVIFHDNDIEIFIDANGDTHNYIELEVNALNTVWDLFLAKPYREGGPVINEYDIKGLQTAIKINGTLNNPSDIDDSWTVEVAIPWENITATYTPKRVPHHGENMRLNFSRVQWETEIIDGKYQKKKVANSDRFLPENNWVWSPMGVIDMHRPEHWGIVTFVDKQKAKDSDNYDEKDTEILRQLLAHTYKKQKEFFLANKAYSQSLEALDIEAEMISHYNLKMGVLAHSFEITGTSQEYNKTYLINTEGRLQHIK